MSADNYLYVRKAEGRYFVTNEGLSADEVAPLETAHHMADFDTLAAAWAFVNGMYEASDEGTGPFIEYGPGHDDECAEEDE